MELGLLPPELSSDEERMNWTGAPSNLEGIVLSLEKLKEMFPGNEHDSGIFVLMDQGSYKIHGFKFKKEGYVFPVAYECNSCSSIVIGPPRIEDENSIDSSHPLLGREGYDLYCHSCDVHLKDITIALSRFTY